LWRFSQRKYLYLQHRFFEKSKKSQTLRMTPQKKTGAARVR
jgi:hypothetical protein